MNRRVQITISNHPASGGPGTPKPLGPLNRFKILLGGFVLAVVSIAILVAAFVLGYILAALLLVAFILVIAAVIFKRAIRRTRPL